MNRQKLFYFIYFGAAATLSPYLVLYYESLGLTGTQIGLLTGIVPLVTLFSSTLWGAVADASRRYRGVVLLAIAGLWVSALLMTRVVGIEGLLATVVLFAFFGAPVGSLMDNSVVTQLGERKNEYGRIRLWGSVGWGFSAFIMGPVLERAGLEWAFYGYLAVMGVLFLYTLTVPIVGTERTASFKAGLRVLLGDGRFLGLLVMALIFGISLGMSLNYLFLHMSAMGASETLMAWTLVMATISEVPFLFLSGRIISRYGINRIIAVAFLLMATRAFIYAFMPAPWWVLPVNLLLGGPTFALFWAGAVAEANRLAPPGLGGTAQGALGSVMFGLGSAAGNFFGGIIFERYGAPPLMQSVGWLLAITLVVFVALRLAPRRHVPDVAIKEP